MPTNKKTELYIESLGKILAKLSLQDVNELDGIMHFFTSQAIKQTIRTYIERHTTDK